MPSEGVVFVDATDPSVAVFESQASAAPSASDEPSSAPLDGSNISMEAVSPFSFDNSIPMLIASYLDPHGLACLAMTCRRFGSKMDRDVSLAEQVAHEIMDERLTDAVLKGALPFFDDKSRLTAYHEMEILRLKKEAWDNGWPRPRMLSEYTDPVTGTSTKRPRTLDEMYKHALEEFMAMGVDDSAHQVQLCREDFAGWKW